MQAFCKELSFLPKESHEMLQGCPSITAWESNFYGLGLNFFSLIK